MVASAGDACAFAARAAVRSERPRLAGDLAEALQSQSDLTLSLLATLSAFLRPLQKLESLVAFESLRQDENPLVAPLKGNLDEIRAALAAHGITPLSATVGTLYDEESHERVARGGAPLADDFDDHLIVREVVRSGLAHSATGTVLVPVLVHASTASKPGGCGASAAAAASPPLQTPRGTRVHEVSSSDTVQGLAVRYGVQPATLMRLNKLPTAQALFSRKTIRLPPLLPSFASSQQQGDVPDRPPSQTGVGPRLVGGGNEGASTTTASLAKKIALRRQAGVERRREGGGDGAVGLAEIDEGESGEGSCDQILALQVENALRAALVRQQACDPSNVDCAVGWLREQMTPAVSDCLASALLHPLRAVSAADNAAQELSFLHSMVEQASEKAVHALLEREGDLLRSLATSLWRGLVSLRSTADTSDGSREAVAAAAAAAPPPRPGAMSTQTKGLVTTQGVVPALVHEAEGAPPFTITPPCTAFSPTPSAPQATLGMEYEQNVPLI
jgi:hypothetical protein